VQYLSDGGDDERRGREEKIPILDRSGQSRRSAPCPIRVGDGNSGFFTEGAGGGGGERSFRGPARAVAARAATLARRQAAPAVVYAASGDLFAPSPPSPRARYIFIVKTVADDLEYVFSRGNARSHLTSPRPSVRPSVHPRRTERAFCAA